MAINEVVVAQPRKIVFQGKTTIVFWSDNTKTMVRCGDLDVYDREAAVAFAVAHKLFGSKSKFKKFVSDGFEAMSVEEENIRQAVKATKRLKKEQEEEGSF